MSDVAAFLDSRAHPMRPEIDSLRALIQAAAPELSEHVKWNAPSFHARGDDCITLNLPRETPKSKLVRVVFHRGAKPKRSRDLKSLDPDGLLQWAAPDRGVASFASLAEIDSRADALQALVRRWVAEALAPD